MTSRWWPALIVAAVVLAFSLVPLGGGLSGGLVSDGGLSDDDVSNEGVSDGGGTVAGIGADKLLHVVDYAALSLALCYATRARSARACLLAFAAAVAFGGAVELLQLPIPTRRGSLLDMAANTVGAAAASSGWWLLRRESGARTERSRS